MTLAEKIKRIREKKGMTQKEVASLMGISQQAYGQYESGGRVPKLETVTRIAEALGVCVPELYPEGMQAMPILEWMESKGIPLVSGPHEEEQADPFDDDPYDHPVQPADVEKMTKWLVHQKELLDSITNDFAFLNDEGQEEAAKRIQELTEIPKYRRRIEDELQDKPTGEE